MSAQMADAFEVHVTAALTALTRLPEFRETCRTAGVKALVIDLGDDVPRQPMTCSRVLGDLAEAHAEALRVKTVLEEVGFGVTRLKIEAAPWNTDLPSNGYCYYEHHARLLLPSELAQQQALAKLCQRLGVHLSRNPFKAREDGTQQRFITLRHPPITREEAAQTAENLWATLRGAGYTIEKTITEYCVYDTNRELDVAWERT